MAQTKIVNFGILLKSFKGDLAYVTRLIKSYIKYNVDNIPLFIVVPKEDLSLFEKFISSNVKLYSDESITSGLVDDDSVRGIRPGYINQEIIKLAFWEKKLCKNYFCMDSDAVFIRNFYISDFMYDEDTPYTILVEDNELKVDPIYYKTHWVGREKLIRKIQKAVGLNDKIMLTCHAFAIFSSKVLESFYLNYLVPSHLTYSDILKIAPYEFSWYNMWLQKDKTISIKIREPLIKYFHNKYQHQNYIRQEIKVKDIARGYIGLNINSNYSRDFGIISYEDGDVYVESLEEMYISIKQTFRSFIIQLLRKYNSIIGKRKHDK